MAKRTVTWSKCCVYALRTLQYTLVSTALLSMHVRTSSTHLTDCKFPCSGWPAVGWYGLCYLLRSVRRRQEDDAGAGVVSAGQGWEGKGGRVGA